jgi:hypothetical protein
MLLFYTPFSIFQENLTRETHPVIIDIKRSTFWKSTDNMLNRTNLFCQAKQLLFVLHIVQYI